MRSIASSDGILRPGEPARDHASETFQLQWLESFETGNLEIDCVHRQLIQDCNILLAMIVTWQSWPLIVAKAKTVVEDCIAHFRLEEAVLERTQFSRCAEHAAVHRRLEHELRMAIEQLENHGASFADRFEHARWLGEILISAIVRNDLDFRSHIMNEQGR